MMQALERLRLAREEHGLDVDALAKRTRLRVHLLEAVEQGRFDDLPRGVYARAVVRAYAEGVGLDPNRIMTEIAPLLPQPEDPLDGMARVRGFDRPARRPAAAGAPPPLDEAARDDQSGNRGHSETSAIATRDWELPALAPDLARTAAASAIDGAILAAISLVLVAATASVAGIPASTLVELAGPAMVAIAGFIAGLYFVLLGGIRGATVGARFMSVAQVEAPAGPAAADALRRAWTMVLREGSILVDVLLPAAVRWDRLRAAFQK